MEWRDRIISDPTVLVGKPVIKDTRISVELILGWLANGWTYKQILESYPHITREDILAALAFAEEMMRDEQHIAAHKAVA
ncbi:MAG: antitoxin [Hydrogenophilales bacterium 17-61-9]|nr:MAG: antitoxin [Hydrogenophilales bacterium 17-61-9]